MLKAQIARSHRTRAAKAATPGHGDCEVVMKAQKGPRVQSLAGMEES